MTSLPRINDEMAHLQKKFNKTLDAYHYHAKRTRRMMSKGISYDILLDDVNYSHHEVLQEEAYDAFRRHFRDMNACFRRIQQTRRLRRSQAARLEKEICPICCDSHRCKDMVQTSCGHLFGKTCFTKLRERCYDAQQEVMCPLCRLVCPLLTQFKTSL